MGYFWHGYLHSSQELFIELGTGASASQTLNLGLHPELEEDFAGSLLDSLDALAALVAQTDEFDLIISVEKSSNFVIK